MKKHSLFYLICVLVLSINCQKPIINLKFNLHETGDSLIREIWKSGEAVYSMIPVINKDGNVLISHSDANDNNIFKLLDKNNGQVIWEWQDYFLPEGLLLESSRIIAGNYMYLACGNRTYCIDIVNGNTVWKTVSLGLLGESFFVKSQSGWIYRVFYTEDMLTMKFFRTGKGQTDWVEVFSLDENSTDAKEVFVGNVQVYESNSTDILAFTLNKRFNSKPEELLLGAVDLLNKKLIYHLNQNGIATGFSRIQGAAEDSSFITFGTDKKGNWSVFSFNMMNGNLQWTYKLPDFGVFCNFYNSKLIVLCNGKQPVLCINKLNGKLNWSVPTASSLNAMYNFTSDDSRVYGQYLFSSQCEYLNVFDLDNGTKIFEEKILKETNSSCMEFAGTVDTTNDCWYVGDRRYVYCLSLPSACKF